MLNNMQLSMYDVYFNNMQNYSKKKIEEIIDMQLNNFKLMQSPITYAIRHNLECSTMSTHK